MEKFALLNLLNLLQGLAPNQGGAQTPDEQSPQPPLNAQPAPPPQQEQAVNSYPNVMASVIERHEAISNRIKNKK